MISRSGGKGRLRQLLNELISYKAFCKTAPATPDFFKKKLDGVALLIADPPLLKLHQ